MASAAIQLTDVLETYMVVPDAPAILESMMDVVVDQQLPHLPDASASGEAQPTDVASAEQHHATPSKPNDLVQKGIRRCAEWYQDLCDEDRGGKRHKKNQQDGVPDVQWMAGVSLEPVPGWSKLTFLYAPRSAWQKVEVYAHATTTVGDVKVCLEPLVKFRHNDFCCFGLQTHEKLAYHEEIAAHHAYKNREPLEPRLCIPSRFTQSQILHSRFVL